MDAVAEPEAIRGDAAASTFVKLEPSPKKVNASILPLTFIEPVN
jgi:hypothetical protein